MAACLLAASLPDAVRVKEDVYTCVSHGRPCGPAQVGGIGHVAWWNDMGRHSSLGEKGRVKVCTLYCR